MNSKHTSSTARYAGKNRIIISPSPVAAAPPTFESAYAPDPGIGESPTLLFKKLVRQYNERD